jgi:hypothetical protein
MSISFLYGTIPFMKPMERMTNPCFQDKDFAKVMKGKHVEGDPDDICVELEDASGTASENFDANTTDPIATGDSADPTATGDGSNRENVDPIEFVDSSARSRRKRVLVPPLNVPQGKELRAIPPKAAKKKKDGFAPDYHSSPPVVPYSIRFPIPVTREKLNCAFGNTVNLLTYINHFNTGLKQKLLDLQTQQSYRGLLEIQTCIKHCGYDIMVLPQITCFTSLQSFVTKLSVPMLVSVELKCRTYMLRHVIGILPIISRETGQVKYHIIDGAHPEMKAMKFSQENILVLWRERVILKNCIQLCFYPREEESV